MQYEPRLLAPKHIVRVMCWIPNPEVRVGALPFGRQAAHPVGHRGGAQVRLQEGRASRHHLARAPAHVLFAPRDAGRGAEGDSGAGRPQHPHDSLVVFPLHLARRDWLLEDGRMLRPLCKQVIDALLVRALRVEEYALPSVHGLHRVQEANVPWPGTAHAPAAVLVRGGVEEGERHTRRERPRATAGITVVLQSKGRPFIPTAVRVRAYKGCERGPRGGPVMHQGPSGATVADTNRGGAVGAWHPVCARRRALGTDL